MPAWMTSELRLLVSGADDRAGIEHEDFAAGERQRPRGGEAYDAGADDDAVNAVH